MISNKTLLTLALFAAQPLTAGVLDINTVYNLEVATGQRSVETEDSTAISQLVRATLSGTTRSLFTGGLEFAFNKMTNPDIFNSNRVTSFETNIVFRLNSPKISAGFLDLNAYTGLTATVAQINTVENTVASEENLALMGSDALGPLKETFQSSAPRLAFGLAADWAGRALMIEYATGRQKNYDYQLASKSMKTDVNGMQNNLAMSQITLGIAISR
jgi:hypothetical protein